MRDQSVSMESVRRSTAASRFARAAKRVPPRLPRKNPAGAADAGALRMIGLAFSAITAAVALVALLSVLTSSGPS